MRIATSVCTMRDAALSAGRASTSGAICAELPKNTNVLSGWRAERHVGAGYDNTGAVVSPHRIERNADLIWHSMTLRSFVLCLGGLLARPRE